MTVDLEQREAKITAKQKKYGSVANVLQEIYVLQEITCIGGMKIWINFIFRTEVLNTDT